MIVTPSQMKAAEEAAFRRCGDRIVTPAGLMDVAGLGIAKCLRQFFPDPGTIIFFCGKGHNGGDALVAARHLSDWGWKIIIRLAFPLEEMVPLTRFHLESLPAASVVEKLPEKITGLIVLMDGLLGTGSSGAPSGVIAERIAEMNNSRRMYGGHSIAIDLPSGLDGLKGNIFCPCVQADFTIALGYVKTGLLSDSATAVVGRLALIPLPDVPCDEGEIAEVLTSELLRPSLPIRNFDSYKGSYGRIGILAGSCGFLGAARLCSAAAVHAGGGLVTLYTLTENYELLASLCIPEVMVQKIDSYLDLLSTKNDVLAIGPGLGELYHKELRTLVGELSIPCVLDADALNASSQDISILKRCSGSRLLTPHPGEMERLFAAQGRTRRAWAEKFTSEYPVTLLLKGARTLITEQGKFTLFNTTGNPGMGTGGMGDVLTGVCAALIGSGLELREAAMLGAWLSGRAAEIAVFNRNQSQESLTATSVINNLGVACDSLRMGDF